MQNGKKTIFTLAVAILACAVLYGVMVREQDRAAAVAAAELAAAETPAPTPEPVTGVREPDYLIYLTNEGLQLRAEDPSLGEYGLAAREGAPTYPLTILLHADGFVGGFLLEFPAVQEPKDVNWDSAVDQALILRAEELLQEEQAAIGDLLPALLAGAAEAGELPAGVRDRWLQAARSAREIEPGAMEHESWTFEPRLSEDGALTLTLRRETPKEDEGA